MITVSGPHVQPSISAKKVQPAFGDQAKYEKYVKKLSNFNDNSVSKMADIIALSGKPVHITLSKAYGKEDEGVQYLNKKITKLVAKRGASDPAVSARAKEKLDDFRHAIKTTMEIRGYKEPYQISERGAQLLQTLGYDQDGIRIRKPVETASLPPAQAPEATGMLGNSVKFKQVTNVLNWLLGRS